MVEQPCPWVSLISRCMDTPVPMDTEHLLKPLKDEAPALYQWYADHNSLAAPELTSDTR